MFFRTSTVTVGLSLLLSLFYKYSMVVATLFSEVVVASSLVVSASFMTEETLSRWKQGPVFGPAAVMVGAEKKGLTKDLNIRTF